LVFNVYVKSLIGQEYINDLNHKVLALNKSKHNGLPAIIYWTTKVTKGHKSKVR